MDIVYIRDLKIETIIGIYDWEREVKQLVSLDIDMAHDIERAAKTQNIDDALDYGAVSQRLLDFIGSSEFLLIEAMAEQCAAIIIQEFSVPWLRLRIGKPGAVKDAQDVGVIIERGVKAL